MTNDWLKEKLQYDKIFESFERVFSFYGDYYKKLFIDEKQGTYNCRSFPV